MDHLAKHMTSFAILQNYIKRVAQVRHNPCYIRALKVVLHFILLLRP